MVASISGRDWGSAMSRQATFDIWSAKSACAQYISAPGPSPFLGARSWLSFGLDFRREVFPQCAFSLRGTHDAVSGFEHLAGLVRIRNSHSSRTVHNHQAKGGHRHVRYNKQRRPGTTAVNHHQTLRAVAPARHRLDVETHRVQIRSRLGRRPVDSDVNDFAERSVQGLDQLRQFARHRGRVRPPCPVDVAAQRAGQSDPHGTGAPPRPGQAVHEECLELPGEFVSGRSEKVGCSTGSVEVAPEGTTSGTSG